MHAERVRATHFSRFFFFEKVVKSNCRILKNVTSVKSQNWGVLPIRAQKFSENDRNFTEQILEVRHICETPNFEF